MGKFICLSLAILMVIVLAGCGDNNLEDNYVSTGSVVEESGAEQVNNVAIESDAPNTDSNEWKEFLKDYEKWVDDYIVIVKKYQNNPTDMSVLADYSKMMSDLAKWTDRANGIEKSIKNSEEVLEYSKELLRIAGKLAEVG